MSIGHELLINPAVLMLDEPTSGLDSTTALHLLTVLRRLANEGRAVLTTIHQPSSRLYQKLDKLMLLSEGHVMYFGGAHRVTDWFAQYGFHLQLGTNTADFIMDVAMGEVRSGKLAGRPAVIALQRTFEQWYKEHPAGFQDGVSVAQMPPVLLLEEGQAEKGKLGQPEMRVVVDSDSQSSGDGEGKTLAGAPRDGAFYTEQVQVLLTRSLKVRRFEALTGTNMIQMVSLLMVVACLLVQVMCSCNVLLNRDVSIHAHTVVRTCHLSITMSGAALSSKPLISNHPLQSICNPSCMGKSSCLCWCRC